MAELRSSKPSVNSWSPEYLESQYLVYKSDPNGVDASWRHFFEGFDLGAATEAGLHAPIPGAPQTVDLEYIEKAAKVNSLVYHYRDIGHLMARLDPLGRERQRPENLTLDAFGITEQDLDREFNTSIPEFAHKPHKLREIIQYLERIYCQTLGVEYMHIQNTVERRWIQERLEKTAAIPKLTTDERRNILRKLHQAEMFENFLHTRYRGQKRFSLEGSETLIPLLWYALETAGDQAVEEVVFGMAHRGRLNVLANIINKSYDEIFAEFEDNYEDNTDGGGDVKYHKGYASNFMSTRGKLLYLTLAANPSHLEAVNPVVEGRARAKQRLRSDSGRQRVIPLLIHGDAAFAGQGIVAETLQMVKLPGYTTGGTVHIIINNQIGFTTDPASARSTVYCTDVAKMVQAPIFHVNGEDVDMCARVIRMAVEYRQTFGKDIVVDMWCYRKYGHNESDEPAFTQPRMYELIRQKESVSTIYSRQLVAEDVLREAEVKQMQKDLEEVLEVAQQHGREVPVKRNQMAFREQWQGFVERYSFDPVKTAVSYDVLRTIAEKVSHVPENFEPHRKVTRIYLDRTAAVLERKPFDWGTAEMLCYGSLLHEGTPVRLSGQDSRRGTFSHRHAVLTDVNNEAFHIPLNHLSETQARFCIYDSPLSEASVVGFEYGYSLGDPSMLIIWEAQFGDFSNGAQVIIDQFVASAEAKWDRFSGLVFLLPHGYEGQGPEHSSARLERFLQLCADNNIQVANLTTPAQFFHIMRRQMRRNFRKPLVIMSPKSLLRHPRAVSTVEDLTDGQFREVLDDDTVEKKQVSRIVFCSGKVYYDLIARREEIGTKDTAIVRLEQIYPVNVEMIRSIIDSYPKGTRLIWCQEEPKNMGAWTFISDYLEEHMGIRLEYVGRAASPTPATGSHSVHQMELKEFLGAALPAPEAVAVAAGA